VRKLPRTFFLTSLVPLGPDENWSRTNAYNVAVVREWWGDEELGKAYCINCRKRATVNYVMTVSGPNIQYFDIWNSLYADDPLIRRFQNPSYLARVGGFPVQMVNPSGDYMPTGQVTLALPNGIGQDGFIAPSVELPVWNPAAQRWDVQDVTANGVVFDTEMGRVPLATAAPGRGMLTLEEMAYICQFGQLRQAPNRGVSPFREVAAFGASEENCVKFYPLGKDGVCRIVCDGEDRGPCPSGWLSARPSPAPSRPMPTQPMRVSALSRGQFGGESCKCYTPGGLLDPFCPPIPPGPRGKDYRVVCSPTSGGGFDRDTAPKELKNPFEEDSRRLPGMTPAMRRFALNRGVLR
jgi:hypothetical protein